MTDLHRLPRVTRRRFLAQSAAAGSAALLAGSTSPTLSFGAEDKPRRPKVAAIFTEFRFRSHAYDILENCFKPYLFCGQLVDPGIDVVSFYADQFPEADMAREASSRLKVPLFKSIDEALCVGGKEMAVDAVLAIGEHGNYPDNDLGQKIYPRKEFFDQSLAVMKRSGRFVPYFNDKHLSYRFDWAKEMYDAARKHGFPLMAGSSVPLAQRVPPFDVPAGFEVEEAVAVHGGGMEVYGFHGLEVLQSMVESRKGGETGIVKVELVEGEAYEKAIREKRWSQDLVDAAMQAENSGQFRRRPRPAPLQAALVKEVEGPHAIIVHYKDGLKATVLKQGRDSHRWNFACRLKGESKPRALAWYNGPWGNRNLFKALSHAIQSMFITGREPYPVERTLLTGGAIDAAMHSHHEGKPVDTPQLTLSYRPVDFSAFRENGASWKVLTPDTVEHQTFTPGDARPPS